ncbi:MAG TPA: NlpC/P60 family protein [Candidatus Acidoferrales bacterium]|jgi:hypothetical protein|nr:NlpC/P60 family protein [Candidatus Acidoferrales bacterium]
MTQRLWWGFLLLAGTSITLAQVRQPQQETTLSSRPLTRREGHIIVSAAWEREEQGGRKPDCSHLAHEVYALAGYSYPYASSFDLYSGIESFVRVAKPQAGDLIVWRGHVGIVVDPKKHAFYSSVRSGLRTEFYDAPQWKARGPARFYRYATATPVPLALGGEPAAHSQTDPAQAITVPVVGRSRKTLPGPTHPASKSSNPTSPTVLGPQSTSSRATFEIPSSILVAASQAKPTAVEIAGAISELNSATGDILREQDLSKLGGKVIIYDDFVLDRIDIKGKHGSAQARVQSRMTLVGGRFEGKRRPEKFRWELLRMSDGWEVLAPQNSFYVPRDVAIRMLAARLASLTQQGNSPRGDSFQQQVKIVRVLSALLSEI